MLAVLSVVGGWIGLPHGFLWGDRVRPLPRAVAGDAAAREAHHPTTGTLLFLIAVASGVGLAGIGARLC